MDRLTNINKIVQWPLLSAVANMPKNDKLCGISPEHSYYGLLSECLGHALNQSLRF
jgi:hypothetical protein